MNEDAVKLLFLDIDGVLNNNASLAMNVHLAPEKVCLLYDVCRRTNSFVVISSSWRGSYTLAELAEMLWVTGFKDKEYIVGTTPCGFNFTSRGEEVQSVLDATKNLENYAIVDDNSDFLPHQFQFFVQTNMRQGLCYRHVDQLIEILS